MDENLIDSINAVTQGGPEQPVQAPAQSPVQQPAQQPVQPAPIPVNPAPTPAGNPLSSTPVTPVPTPQPVFASPKAKSPIFKIIAVVFLILAITAGVVATLFFTGVIGGNKDTGETVLEDRDIINPIEQKLANLFGEPADLSVIETSSPDYDDVDFFLNGEYTDEQMLWIAFKNLDGYYKEFTEEEITAFREYWSTTGYEMELFDNSIIQGFGADQFEAKYEELFGGTPSETNENTGRVYHIGNNYFAFYVEEITSADRRFYNKVKYTKEGDVVHAYVASAAYNMADKKVYCGVYQTGDEERPVVCQDVSEEGKYFDPEEMDNGKYFTRRFDFKKSDKGEYYIIGSEITTTPETEFVVDYDIEEDATEEDASEEESIEE